MENNSESEMDEDPYSDDTGWERLIRTWLIRSST